MGIGLRGHTSPRLRTAIKGYTINLIYFFAKPGISCLSVRRRVESGGHNIPEDVIRRRYERGRKNLLELYLPLSDK